MLLSLRINFVSLCDKPMKQTNERVNHPAHYNRGGIEAIDVIEAWELGFNSGNAVKYLSRAGYKDGASTIEDLKKAQWYINREIQRLEKGTL